MTDADLTYAHPPYTPMTSLRHELGIMFGFAAACILTVGVYYIFWQASQRRAAARDEARSKDLRARGFHHERGGYHDKALNRYASRDPVAQTQGQTLEFLTAPDQFDAGQRNNSGQPEDAVSSSSSSRVPMMRPSAAAAAGKVKYPIYEAELQTFSTEESSAQSASSSAPWARKADDLL